MDITSWLITVLIFLFTIFFTKFIWCQWEFYKLSWKLPGPFALPVLGNALYFWCKDEDIFDTANNIINNYSSPMRFWFGSKFTMIISDAHYAEKIMTSMKFTTKGDIYKFLKVFVGEGLISGSGTKWRRDRKLMAPLFVIKNISNYFPVMLQRANVLKDALQKEVNKDYFDIGLWLHRYTFDIVNETILGVRSNSMDGSSDGLLHILSRLYTLVHSRIIKVWLHIDWIYKKTHYFLEAQKEKEEMYSLVKKGIRTTSMQQLNSDQSNQDYRSLSDQLTEIKENHPEFATEDEILHHLATLYTASEDTVMTICSFSILILGMYPKIQDKIAREIESVIGENGPFELSNLEELPYLDMCVKDVLRLFSIGPFLMRTTTEACIIGNLSIPKNCSIVIAIHNLHRNPEYWEKPNEFYPDHFLPENVKKRPPYAYMPFSAGPRSCIGKLYAYMVIKTVLITLLQNYRIESDGNLQDLKLKTDISVRTRDNCYPVRIKQRSYE